jgi:hypothetical protein
MIADPYIAQLNSNSDLSLIEKFTLHYHDENLTDDLIINPNVDCTYYDPTDLKNLKCLSSSPLFLSLNIQSLNSKYESLKSLITQLGNDNIIIDVIAIQETWDIQYPEYLLLPGFQSFVFKKRAGMRGGGVGFYIKKGINYKILPDCSPFENKIIETLTLKLTYPNSKSLLVTNIYRSNGPILNVSQSQQIDRFLVNFDDLLRSLSGKRHESLIFTDSNLDLLKIGHHEKISTYMDSVFSHGYLQTILKATRIHNDKFSLIDHIFTNTACTSVKTGVLISDISDHFPTIFTFGSQPSKCRQKATISRIYFQQNMEKFRLNLSEQNWLSVTACNDVNDAYDAFWNIYSNLHDTNFPLKRCKFNRKIHKEQEFMTHELLLLRADKNILHKKALSAPTPENLTNYRRIRNEYNSLLRNAKKTYLHSKLVENAKSPKKRGKKQTKQ